MAYSVPTVTINYCYGASIGQRVLCLHGYGASMVTVYVSLSMQTWTSVRRGCYAVSIAVSTLWAERTARVPMVTSCKMTAGPVKVGSYPNSLKLKVGFHLEQN